MQNIAGHNLCLVSVGFCPDMEMQSAKSISATLMNIWGRKNIRTSWCLSIFLWMRNLLSQRNITRKLRDSTRWDSLWGGSYSRRIGFLWLWGHPKIYSSQGICNVPCQKDNIGSGEEGKVIHLCRVLHSPLCTKSFQSPAGLHAYHASLNELHLPVSSADAHTNTWLVWTSGGLPAFSTRTQQSPALSTQSIYRCTHTHTTCTRTLYIHNTLKIALLTHFAQIKGKIYTKKS